MIELVDENSTNVNCSEMMCNDDIIREEYTSTPVNVTRDSRVSLLINSSLIGENMIISYVIQILGYISISDDLFFCEQNQIEVLKHI